MTKLNSKGTLRLVGTAAEPAGKWHPPAMPQCLPASSKAAFAQVCRNLYAEGLWHDDRLPLVVSYLSAAHLVERLTGSINRDGVQTADGKLNPAAKALSMAVTTLAKAGATLGLTVVRSLPTIAEEPPAPAAAANSRWAKAAGHGDDNG